MNGIVGGDGLSRWGSARLLLIATAIFAATATGRAAQDTYHTGQNITPAYEGWEQNPDGSFNLVFGYFNRNWDEEIDLPIGPDNAIEQGGPDQGQPTHFFPRRNRFVFRIRVPGDFGKKELVWTLTSHGKTERAYGTLHPDYFIDDSILMENVGGGAGNGVGAPPAGNKPPQLKLEQDPIQRVRAGQPITLTAWAKDDGIPKPSFFRPTQPSDLPGAVILREAHGLRVSWFVYRGEGKITFSPPQIEVWEDTRLGANSPWSAGWKTPPSPPDGKWVVHATFHEPGTYILECLAHDGALGTSERVRFDVMP
jgi:hypothetical protein